MGVQTEIDRIADAKMAIKAAIEEKGVTVPVGTPIDEYAGKIGEIESGGGQTCSVQISYGGNSIANIYFIDEEGTYQALTNPASINIHVPAIVYIYADPSDPMLGYNAWVDSVSGGEFIRRDIAGGGFVSSCSAAILITELVASISVN